jgi:hypothetical protein
MERNFDKFLEGYDAYDEGQKLHFNPYQFSRHTEQEFEAWNAGWFAGQEDEQHREHCKSLEERS